MAIIIEQREMDGVDDIKKAASPVCHAGAPRNAWVLIVWGMVADLYA